MKYFLVLLGFIMIAGGCSSSNKNNTQQQQASYTTHQENYILDQEFDLLVAPEYDYNTEVKYEDQIKNTYSGSAKTKQPAGAKSAKKPAATKVN